MQLFSARLQSLKKVAFDHGFDHCAFAPARISAEDASAYQSWCDDGMAGGMEYMTRNRDKRTDLNILMEGAKTVMTVGVSYYQGPLPAKPGPNYGRVARYAWGLDYHPIILERLEKLISVFQNEFGLNARTVAAVDTKPVLERALAKSAGLGFVGKNTVLIVPKIQFHVGSYVFLGEILLDIPLEEEQKTPELGGCGSCTKCLDACPTDAFEKPYRLNAEKCIAYLTIENKGSIPLEMREKVGDWIFGCDVCQDVCPFNARAYETRWPEFQPDRGVGPWISLKQVLQTPGPTEFKTQWGHTPLSRPKWKGLLRNACVAAGNSGDQSLLPILEPLTHNSEPLISEHALWAVEKLSTRRGVPAHG